MGGVEALTQGAANRIQAGAIDVHKRSGELRLGETLPANNARNFAAYRAASANARAGRKATSAAGG